MKRVKQVLKLTGLGTASLALGLCLAIAAPLWAETDGTAGATFLKIGVGARPTAMGGTYVGVADDIYALRWNPAGLTQLEHAQVAAQHLNQFADINHEFIAVAAPLNQRLTWGADVVMLHTEDYYRTEFQDLGTFSNRDVAGGLSLAYAVKPSVSVGISGRYIYQRLETSTAHGWESDLGLLYRPENSPWSFGVSALNLGPKIKFERAGDPLPQILKGGLAYRWPGERILLAADVSFPNDGDPYGSIGGEFRFTDYLALRSGYEIGTDYKGFEALSAGLAFSYQMFVFDYAFVPRDKLGNIHRFGIRLDLASISPRPGRTPMIAPVVTREVPIAPPLEVDTPRPSPRAAPDAPPPPPEPEPLPELVPDESMMPRAIPVPAVLPGPSNSSTRTIIFSSPRSEREREAEYQRLYNEGISYFQQGDYQQALTSLHEAGKLLPNRFATHYALSDVYYAVGDYANAQRELELAHRYLK